MKKFTGTVRVETAASPTLVAQAGVSPGSHAMYVGLDVHKETIAVGVAAPGRGEPVYRGEIANTPKAIAKLVAQLQSCVPNFGIRISGDQAFSAANLATMTRDAGAMQDRNRRSGTPVGGESGKQLGHRLAVN